MLIAIHRSARIALCNRICLLIGYNTYLTDETDLFRIESCRAELSTAIRSTADNVKQLLLNGVADKLPISACVPRNLPTSPLFRLSIRHVLMPLKLQSSIHPPPANPSKHPDPALHHPRRQTTPRSHARLLHRGIPLSSQPILHESHICSFMESIGAMPARLSYTATIVRYQQCQQQQRTPTSPKTPVLHRPHRK